MQEIRLDTLVVEHQKIEQAKKQKRKEENAKCDIDGNQWPYNRSKKSEFQEQVLFDSLKKHNYRMEAIMNKYIEDNQIEIERIVHDEVFYKGMNM